MSLYDVPSGDFTPFVKYNSKAGRWFVKKDDQEVEVSNPVFVADLANAKKAWMHFKEGQAPSIKYFPSLDASMPKPTEDHKLGISINLYSNDNFGGVVKMESNSINTCSALNALYEQYESAPESKEGKLPVVAVKGSEPVKGNFGTNFKPVFEITKWVDRPDALKEQASQPAPLKQKQESVQETSNSVSEF